VAAAAATYAGDDEANGTETRLGAPYRATCDTTPLRLTPGCAKHDLPLATSPKAIPVQHTGKYEKLTSAGASPLHARASHGARFSAQAHASAHSRCMKRRPRVSSCVLSQAPLAAHPMHPRASYSAAARAHAAAHPWRMKVGLLSHSPNLSRVVRRRGVWLEKGREKPGWVV
jgi:hypothetical protein